MFPRTSVQLCIVYMVRHSLNYVSWKRRAEVAADLKRIYQLSTADEAELRLGEFEADGMTITKNRGSFPSDEALLKLFYLALCNISKK